MQIQRPLLSLRLPSEETKELPCSRFHCSLLLFKIFSYESCVSISSINGEIFILPFVFFSEFVSWMGTEG